MSEILVVDDERSMRELLEIMLAQAGEQVRVAGSAAAATALIEERTPDLVITDLRMKGGSGLDLLRQTKRDHPAVEFIVVTAFATDETALEALRMGAYDYVTKPFQLDEMRVVVQRALERQRLLRENVSLRARLSSSRGYADLVGKTPRMQEVYRLIEQAAPTRANVLVTGESGTGKDLVARALHNKSDRREKPFVPIDCTSIPDSLLEGELFGHARGAFTGAVTERAGLFELADGGTAFLDEIGEVPIQLQVKLLRVIQERSLKRLGETKDRKVDVRLVAASNRDLDLEVEQGRFRQDLFFRLNVIQIHLPPLRQRREDIPDLVRHFVAKVCKQEQCTPPLVLRAAVDALMTYSFPGNVRELENLVERAVALAGNRPIGPELFTEHMRIDQVVAGLEPGAFPSGGLDMPETLAEIERRLIRQALSAAGGVKKEAARLLGLSFRSLRYRIEKLDMD